MTVAGPSLVLPTLSTIFSSSTPPTALFPQTIVLLHTVREWIPIILQEAEKRIIQKEKENEIRKNKGKGKAREEGGEEGEELELVQLRKLRVSFGKGKKLEGKGLNLELALKAVHIRSILFGTPTSLSSVSSLIDAYFPRPPPPNQATPSSSSSSADELKRLANQRRIIQAVFSFVRDFVKSYNGGADDLPSALTSSFSTSELSKSSSYPWAELSGWISSWLVKIEGVWDELEQGVGGTGDTSTTAGTNEDQPSPLQHRQLVSSAKPKPTTSTSTAPVSPPPPSKPSPSSSTAKATKRPPPPKPTTAMAAPPRKKARKSKLGGKTTRDMFGGEDDESEEEFF